MGFQIVSEGFQSVANTSAMDLYGFLMVIHSKTLLLKYVF